MKKNKFENLKAVTVNVYGVNETLIASNSLLNHLSVIMSDAARGQAALGYDAIAETYSDMSHQIFEALKEDGFYDNK